MSGGGGVQPDVAVMFRLLQVLPSVSDSGAGAQLVLEMPLDSVFCLACLKGGRWLWLARRLPWRRLSSWLRKGTRPLPPEFRPPRGSNRRGAKHTYPCTPRMVACVWVEAHMFASAAALRSALLAEHTHVSRASIIARPPAVVRISRLHTTPAFATCSSRRMSAVCPGTSTTRRSMRPLHASANAKPRSCRTSTLDAPAALAS